jgi:hypothetical protein
VVTVFVRDFCNNNARGAAVGSTTRVFAGGELVGITQAEVRLELDCTVRIQLPVRIASTVPYVAQIQLNTAAGSAAERTITIVGR